MSLQSRIKKVVLKVGTVMGYRHLPGDYIPIPAPPRKAKAMIDSFGNEYNYQPETGGYEFAPKLEALQTKIAPVAAPREHEYSVRLDLEEMLKKMGYDDILGLTSRWIHNDCDTRYFITYKDAQKLDEFNEKLKKLKDTETKIHYIPANLIEKLDPCDCCICNEMEVSTMRVAQKVYSELKERPTRDQLLKHRTFAFAIGLWPSIVMGLYLLSHTCGR